MIHFRGRTSRRPSRQSSRLQRLDAARFVRKLCERANKEGVVITTLRAGGPVNSDSVKQFIRENRMSLAVLATTDGSQEHIRIGKVYQ